MCNTISDSLDKDGGEMHVRACSMGRCIIIVHTSVLFDLTQTGHQVALGEISNNSATFFVVIAHST